MQAILSFSKGKENFYGLVQPYILNSTTTAKSVNSGKTIPKGKLKYVVTKLEDGEPTSILGFIASIEPGKRSLYYAQNVEESTSTISLKRNKLFVNEIIYIFS